MTCLPELLAGLGPVWHGVMAVAALALWLAALRRVRRDLNRPTATGPHLARCGLPPAPSTRAAVPRRAPPALTFSPRIADAAAAALRCYPQPDAR